LAHTVPLLFIGLRLWFRWKTEDRELMRYRDKYEMIMAKEGKENGYDWMMML
jgi:hypothetical protein